MCKKSIRTGCVVKYLGVEIKCHEELQSGMKTKHIRVEIYMGVENMKLATWNSNFMTSQNGKFCLEGHDF